MVSSLLADAVASPTAVLLDLFAADPDIDAFPARVAAHFAAVFATDAALAEIAPLDALDSDPRHHRALVRFSAMVQDTSPSPEIYLARRSDASCGGWGLADPSTGAEHINYRHLRDATVFWAVSVPAQSPWCPHPSSAPHNPSRPHKFPVPNHPHLGVQLKAYHNYPVKPTELHTFVGILTSEPLHADLEDDNPALVPTLHVLFSIPTPTTIVPRVYPDPAFTKHTRDQLITWIADASLARDKDAAEWVLLAAIARVQSRTPPILPLTLTVSRFPSPSTASPTPALSHVLAQIFPLVTTLPLSLNSLNTTSFAPESKNEDLHSGWLQLPRGTICVVTEGGVSEGKVSERGLNNLKATQEMMNAQTLQYVFPYSAFGFETDVAFVVLSEGRKSAFYQTNANIPLKPAIPDFDFYQTPDEIAHTAPKTEAELDRFRALVGAAKIGSATINDQTAQFIQEDFVQERQAAPAKDDVLTQDNLIQRMMLARLLALSMQEPEITVLIWEKAKQMERTRRARISQ